MAKARHAVHLTEDAAADIEEIVECVESRDSIEGADRVFRQLKSAVLSLEQSPNRGRVVPELREIGVADYREVVRKPYRIVFFAMERQVYVVAIVDGRRDIEELLARRLLR